MITRQEVMEFSKELRLRPDIIEKDYVLAWVLAGISHVPELNENWVFKGGTCLKKCYFETYRFSEDLDFTILKEEHLNDDFLLETFHNIAAWIYDSTGIEIPEETIRFEIYTNPRGATSIQGKIGYRGPMRQGGDPPRIKLDLTNDELLVLQPVVREVHHPYSDRPEDGIHLHCYSFEEIFAEKFRALGERERPRDLYDVIHLYRYENTEFDRSLITTTLERKCAFKDIDIPSMEALESQPARSELETEWENMLAHQLPILPPFSQFWKILPDVFNWLFHKVEQVKHPPIPILGRAIDESYRPPAMVSRNWPSGVPMEIIRYAASNFLCVDLIYQGSHRLIEPYSLRQTREGNLLLYAVKHHSGEIRSYRVDRIQGAQPINQPYTPRYAVELTQVGVSA